MLTRPIYLDNCATTRVDPRVLQAMLPYFCEQYGNAASRSHAFGWEAEEAVDTARQEIASLIGARAPEIVLTSGSTESNNLAIKGTAYGHGKTGGHIITAATEHKSVLDTCQRLSDQGFEVTVLPVDPFGRVSVEQVEKAIRNTTLLVSLMAVNNETGTMHPIVEIAEACRKRGVLFHTDATQAAGKIPLNMNSLPADLLSFSAHKMYGPKGVGAIYLRRKTPKLRLQSLIDGGGHQDGMRSGTLPVPLVVGFGAACRLAGAGLADESRRLCRLRDRLESGILRAVPDAILNGHPTLRSSIVTNIGFPDVDSEALLTGLKDIAVSSGSACTSASPRPSHVLTAMGIDEELARATLRLSVGRFTSEEEIDYAIEVVVRTVLRLRRSSATRTPVGRTEDVAPHTSASVDLAAVSTSGAGEVSR